MSETHTSYEVSKRLKEFLGESAPEPIVFGFYKIMIQATDTPAPVFFNREAWYNEKLDFPSYQLHDLLSKTFLKAMQKKMGIRHWEYVGYQIYDAYTKYGGLASVEKALMEMMK